MIRKNFLYGQLRLSYLDNEQFGKPVIVCLHGLFGNARYYANILELEEYHVYSLDQRGHGFSSHAKSGEYTISHFLNDFFHFMDEVVKSSSVTVIGHSLGGIIAYYGAVSRPEIAKMILEDIGAVEQDDCSFARDIVNRAMSLKDLGDSLKTFHITDPSYFVESAFEDEAGWGFRFDRSNIPEAQTNLNGDHWKVFLKSSCPVLLIHGRDSWVVSDEHILEMEHTRENTRAVLIENASHGVNHDKPDEFFAQAMSFIKE
nr:alpha/beta hydrolase [uncultured Clostridium sp.]